MTGLHTSLFVVYLYLFVMLVYLAAMFIKVCASSLVVLPVLVELSSSVVVLKNILVITYFLGRRSLLCACMLYTSSCTSG